MSEVEKLTAEFLREVERITAGALGDMRRTEFVDRLACALWVAWDPLNRHRDPNQTPEATEAARDETARKCIREAERLWRVRISMTADERPEGKPT